MVEDVARAVARVHKATIKCLALRYLTVLVLFEMRLLKTQPVLMLPLALEHFLVERILLWDELLVFLLIQ